MRTNKNYFKSLIQFSLVVIAITGCSNSSSVSSEPITPAACEADKSFAFIPGGEFLQGSDKQERDYAYQISAQASANSANRVTQAEQKLRETGWFNRESDRTTTSLEAFCLSRNLITNQEYQEFIRATNHRTPGISEADYQQQGFTVHPYSKVKEFLWTNNLYPAQTAQHPVVLVSYDDALAYAEWKSETTGANYRLPTAKEWEKAARGMDGKYFPWGNQWQDDATNAAASGLNYTSEIAQFPKSQSEYGIEDMAGNVFEYTATLNSQQQRVVMKGCSWDDSPGFCRAAYQHTRPVDSRHILFGFRLVKE